MCALRKEKKMGNISAFIFYFCLKRHQQLLLLLSSVRAAACLCCWCLAPSSGQSADQQLFELAGWGFD